MAIWIWDDVAPACVCALLLSVELPSVEAPKVLLPSVLPPNEKVGGCGCEGAAAAVLPPKESVGLEVVVWESGGALKSEDIMRRMNERLEGYWPNHV